MHTVEHSSWYPDVKSEPKEKGYMGSHFTEPTPTSLTGKSNVFKTPTVEMFGTDTPNLDSVARNVWK